MIPHQDYSDKEFLQEFISDQVIPSNTFVAQRVTNNELIKLVAQGCRYPQSDVTDVLNSLWNVVNVNLEMGREFNFGGIFTAKLYKPSARRLWDNNRQDFKTSSARPRFKLVPAQQYARYLHKGIHAPVNYFPVQKSREMSFNKEEFSAIQSEAIAKWQLEENLRFKKKNNENNTSI